MPTSDVSSGLTTDLDRSYRALLDVPALGRVMVGQQIARIAQAAVSVAIVLFTLVAYGSPALAGVVTFVGILPGLLISPVAGALLDRHGRTRLVLLDYAVALGSLVLIGLLSLAGLLPPWLLILIAALSSLTGPLSNTGLRSLYPLIVPPHLWERVNAVDSNGYVVATIIGPPVAAGLVAIWGGAVALILIGLVFGLAALVLLEIPEPVTDVQTSGRLLVDAWNGLRYFWRNRTLRGLGVAMTVWNLSGGMMTIVVPLIVLQRLHQGEAVVGLVFAVMGVSGVGAALLTGRIDSRGRERSMLTYSILAWAPALALMLVADNLVVLAASMFLLGLVSGPADVALFTLRQRRTDPAWTGRAFAVSMAFNFLGFPIGSALTGGLVGISLNAAIVFGVAASVVAAILAATTIPASE